MCFRDTHNYEPNKWQIQIEHSHINCCWSCKLMNSGGKKNTIRHCFLYEVLTVWLFFGRQECSFGPKVFVQLLRRCQNGTILLNKALPKVRTLLFAHLGCTLFLISSCILSMSLLKLSLSGASADHISQQCQDYTKRIPASTCRVWAQTISVWFDRYQLFNIHSPATLSIYLSSTRSDPFSVQDCLNY